MRAFIYTTVKQENFVDVVNGIYFVMQCNFLINLIIYQLPVTALIFLTFILKYFYYFISYIFIIIYSLQSVPTHLHIHNSTTDK